MKAIGWTASLALCAFVFAGAAPFAAAQQKSEKNQADKAKVSKTEADAMRKLAQANEAEIEMGKLAASKAQHEDVKKFGQKMVDDHGKLLQDLQKLASAKGVSLPNEPSAKDRGVMKKLESASGEQFDRRYMSDMVSDHKNDLKETDTISRQAKDPEFKKAVEQANGVIKEHLQMAEQINSSLRAGAKGSSKGAASSK